MAKNRAVVDTYCQTFYSSIDVAAMDTGASVRDIKHDCLQFHEVVKRTPRWIYLDDTPQSIMDDIVEKSESDPLFDEWIYG